ncbi:MAG: cinA [Herbinix sp.]|jgi:nicotinamide-nucleotide amidase|nr:cinA [Herbinix sp.]
MVVELISVGTELLLGNIVNTNANYLSKKCAELGFSLYFQITVGDNEERFCEVLKSSLLRSDIVILTGGLGPTQDDMTKEAVAKIFERRLVMDEPSKERISSYFSFLLKSNPDRIAMNLGLDSVTQNNWKQALKIEDSIVVDNDNGTAPGYILEADYMDKKKRVILLPGPPSEMVPMFEHHIFPYLNKLQNKVFVSKMVKICGIGESKAETQILDLIEAQTNPTIAPYAKSGEVHFRVTASADSEEEAQTMLEPVIHELFHRFDINIYTTEEEETLEQVVVKTLTSKKLTVTCAESCTGGLLTGRLVNVPGVSSVLKESFITYSNEAKIKYLGVKEDTLREFGAVSERTAAEMAVGAAERTGSDTAIAITGIAGPDGGTEEKPVGLVYISCYVKGEVTVRKFHMKGNREKIREQSVIYALDLLRRNVTKL